MEGCKRFDGAIRGIGGCPMAQDSLVGNAPTERMVELFMNKGSQAQFTDLPTQIKFHLVSSSSFTRM